MALVVTNTSIDNEATGVYRDTTIIVTFDKNLRPDSLTAQNIILYQTLNDEIIGSVTVVIKQQDNHPNIIEIIPLADLEANTKYILYLNADHNLADAVLQGLVGSDGDVLENNFVISFTTGTEIGDSDVVVPEEHNSSGYYSPTDGVYSASGYSTVQVRDTVPYNTECQLNHVNEIIMYFNEAIQASYIPVRVIVEKATWPYTNVDVTYTASGFVLGSGYFNTAKTEYHVPVASQSQDLINNHLFGVYADPIGDFKGYDWFFTSKLWPAYADVRQIRMATNAVFTNIPDALIWLRIHENSLYYDHETGLHYNTELEVPYEVNKWVVCKTIVDLYNLINGVTKSGGNVIRKTLGDLTIQYSETSAANNSVPDQFEDCANKFWTILTGHKNQNTAVKSMQTAYYPGRARRF